MKILETNKTMETLTFTVPISAKFKRQAELFRNQQYSVKKGDRVYYNTLAVLAVDFYCQCMGIETDLKASDSWNQIMQTMADVADLSLGNIGNLECRPVLAGSDLVEVPAEVWGNRIGYLAVRFNAELTEAKILGFMPKADREEIPLSQWRSLEYFLERIEDLNAVTPVTKLSHWLENVFETGWKSLEAIADILDPEYKEPAMRFRKGKTKKNYLEGSKLIGLEKTGDRVALLVRFEPVSEEEFDVEVEVCQTGNKTYLPQDLKLAIIDETGESVMHAIANSVYNIQIDFSAEYDEIFQVQLSLGDTTITELFQI